MYYLLQRGKRGSFHEEASLQNLFEVSTSAEDNLDESSKIQIGIDRNKLQHIMSYEETI